MKQMFIIGLLTLIAGSLHTVSFADDEGIVIIAHKTVAASLKKKDIKKIFLGEKTRWDNNEKIEFVVLKDKKTYKKFLKQYVGKTLSQYRNFWKIKVFSGMDRMPKSFKNESDVISYVSETEGSISFVTSKQAYESNVKIISVGQ